MLTGTSNTFYLEFFVVILVLSGLVVVLIAKRRQDRALLVSPPALPTGVAPGHERSAVPAVVGAKRTYTWPDRIGYYVTFHADGRRPVEVEVTHDWYGFLNPGDRGQLAVEQGCFCGFNRAG